MTTTAERAARLLTDVRATDDETARALIEAALTAAEYAGGGSELPHGFTPLGTHAERLKLKRGQVVAVGTDQQGLRVYRVRHEPWQLGHGAWVLGLEGVDGGYDLTRVVAVQGGK